MSTRNEGGKLQELIEKFGGWAAAALVTLAAVMYQGDKSSTDQRINSTVVATEQRLSSLDKEININRRAIARLQEGKVSKEELKNVQESWIRETQGLREDIRDFMKSQSRNSK